MHSVVVANGDLPHAESPDGAGGASGRDAELVRLLHSADQLIAVDGGLIHCDQLGARPHVLVGDLDSAPAHLVMQAEAGGTKIVRFPTDKDATDLELAIETAELAGATAITVVAAFGGRLDHELASVGLLASDRWSQLTVAATDGQRQLWVVRSQLSLALDVGRTVSLIPWAGSVDGVVTEGLQWRLDRETLHQGSTRGVSNIVDAPTQTITIANGTLLAVTG